MASASYAYEEGGVGNLNDTVTWDQDTVQRLNANLGIETNNWSFFLRGDNLTDYSYKTHDRDAWYIRNSPRYIWGEFIVHINP